MAEGKLIHKNELIIFFIQEIINHQVSLRVFQKIIISHHKTQIIKAAEISARGATRHTEHHCVFITVNIASKTLLHKGLFRDGENSCDVALMHPAIHASICNISCFVQM